MQFNLKGITINSEEDFLKLIEQINTDIEFDNYFKKDKPAEKLLDKKYLITRYRALAAKEKRKSFREEHDCKYCLYYENKSCKADRVCPIEVQEKAENNRKPEKAKCSKDKEGNCPYGNDVGTCFGFCWRKILDEHYETKNKAKKEMEEQKNDK